MVINNDNLLEETETFTVQVVPDPFTHPFGLPPYFFLVPDLTVVEITDSHCEQFLTACPPPLHLVEQDVEQWLKITLLTLSL